MQHLSSVVWSLPNLPVWQGWCGHDLRTWGTRGWTIYLCRRQHCETLEKEQVEGYRYQQISQISWACPAPGRKSIFKISCLTSDFKPVNCSYLSNRFIMILCLCAGLGEHCLHWYVSPELLRQHLLPFACSASFYCITSCWYFLFILINSDFHLGPTFPSFPTIFDGRMNSHLLKLSKSNISHLTSWMLLHVENQGQQYQFSYLKKYLLYHINLILKLDILVYIFFFILV